MSEPLKNIGEMFRTKREEMNLSLKEVENATSIRLSFLEAIEKGNMHQFLSPVYALGFFKQYASFLGFDPDQIISENPVAFSRKPEKQEFSYGIGTLEMRSAPHGGVKWIPNLLWAGIAVVSLVVAWYFAKFLGVM